MKKVLSIPLSIVLLFIIAFPGLHQANADTKSIEVGETVSDFELPDIAGKTQLLSKLKGEKGVLVIFISATCPVSAAYSDRIEKLALDYKVRGINLVGINSNAGESLEEVKQYAAKNKFSFTILKDEGNKIADLLNARVTPEAYLLDSTFKLVYHGRVDNSRKLEMVKTNELRDALDLLIEGKPISKARTLAFGCKIDRAS